jgi:hypothetical protein
MDSERIIDMNYSILEMKQEAKVKISINEKIIITKE